MSKRLYGYLLYQLAGVEWFVLSCSVVCYSGRCRNLEWRRQTFLPYFSFPSTFSPLPVGMGLGIKLCRVPQNFFIFELKLVRFGAFWVLFFNNKKLIMNSVL